MQSLLDKLETSMEKFLQFEIFYGKVLIFLCKYTYINKLGSTPSISGFYGEFSRATIQKFDEC